ncbi:3-keto-disaccharide hydrolase [Hymenobacter coccineus]|uniref:3-keto-alpha-glucoside-1,2-lyase/3-keto-2-hydroxy-glucal hydratase domain-containing protein n=1 Tax=Hymenobacter coccineus TaxID=1908235 RepID=A0A1G1TLF3_9BACT|nr:DUF1080 domain-containing protein [Hymenobacter coccineus]OGX91671.1 hypothetical protein BEN49_19020 [Hymenobacter coccineus]
MKKMIFAALGATLLLGGAGPKEPRGWTPLLDKKLSQWQTYQSYRYQLGYAGKVPTDAQGRVVPPIGYDKNEANVFSVAMQDGEPVLRISGEIYGCVFTRQDFANYDLKLKVKWGTKKWPPRLDEPLDSGVLYNSQGPSGVDYWHSWMLSQEFQVSEYQKGNAMGDYWCIANSASDITAARSATRDTLRFNPAAAPVAMGNGGGNFCYAAANYEVPNGQWNELELISVNGQSVHIVNGHVVMAVRNSSAIVNGQRQPLTHGKIQLQSEAAEVFYKGIQIKPLDAMPAQYARYFSSK